MNKERKQIKLSKFLFVGRLSKNKRLDNLLKTFGEVRKHTPNFTLTIVGEEFDWTTHQLKDLAKEAGIQKQVRILGRVSDKKLNQIYKESDFFVSASEYEGFGIAAIEAMAAGNILILNDIPAFRELVIG